MLELIAVSGGQHPDQSRSASALDSWTKNCVAIGVSCATHGSFCDKTLLMAARKGRVHARRGTPRKRLGMVDADLADELEVLSGQAGVSRDAFTTMVLREGLRALRDKGSLQEELMAS